MRSLIAAALLSASASAQALDSVAFVYGEGNNAGVYAGELRSGEWRRWSLGSRWRLAAYGMGSIGYWRAREETMHKELWDFGVTPVLRLEMPRDGAMPYFEAALGVHWLSGRHINGNREFSTNFQFGEYLAAGLAFGTRHQYAVDLRLHHVSNGGIKNPNPGLTYAAVGLRYHF